MNWAYQLGGKQIKWRVMRMSGAEEKLKKKKRDRRDFSSSSCHAGSSEINEEENTPSSHLRACSIKICYRKQREQLDRVYQWISLLRARDTEESDKQKKNMDTSVACYASPVTRVQRTDAVWCRERAEGVGHQRPLSELMFSLSMLKCTNFAVFVYPPHSKGSVEFRFTRTAAAVQRCSLGKRWRRSKHGVCCLLLVYSFFFGWWLVTMQREFFLHLSVFLSLLD